MSVHEPYKVVSAYHSGKRRRPVGDDRRISFDGFLEQAKLGIKVFSEAMKLVRYLRDAVLRILETFHKAGAGEELKESLGFTLCDPPHNLRRQSDLDTTCHDMFGANEMDVFCDMPEN